MNLEEVIFQALRHIHETQLKLRCTMGKRECARIILAFIEAATD